MWIFTALYRYLVISTMTVCNYIQLWPTFLTLTDKSTDDFFQGAAMNSSDAMSDSNTPFSADPIYLHPTATITWESTSTVTDFETMTSVVWHTVTRTSTHNVYTTVTSPTYVPHLDQKQLSISEARDERAIYWAEQFWKANDIIKCCIVIHWMWLMVCKLELILQTWILRKKNSRKSAPYTQKTSSIRSQKNKDDVSNKMNTTKGLNGKLSKKFSKVKKPHSNSTTSSTDEKSDTESIASQDSIDILLSKIPKSELNLPDHPGLDINDPST